MDRIREYSEPVRGVQLVDLEVFHDERGDLVALEDRTNLPFVLRRVFYMTADRPDMVRANQATSSDLLISAVTGSAIMDVDNGEERSSMPLDGPARGVWTRPGVFIRFRNFSRSTVLLVCASEPFDDTRYFEAPQPALIDASQSA